MYIVPVSLSSSFNRVVLNKDSRFNVQYDNKTLKYDSFHKSSVSFGALQTTVTELVKKRYNNLDEIEEVFNTLIKELIKDKTIKRNTNLAYLIRSYKKSGFRGLLENLRMPNSTSDINALVDKSADNGLELAKFGEEPLLMLLNFGRHGLFDGPTSTRDMRLLFSNGEKLKDKNAIMEFTMGKKGNYRISQRSGEDYVETVYYASTGNKKSETVCYGKGNPSTTYYNKDGSIDFFKNWFVGGTPIVPIY